jgi:hypothetical protein
MGSDGSARKVVSGHQLAAEIFQGMNLSRCRRVDGPRSALARRAEVADEADTEGIVVAFGVGAPASFRSASFNGAVGPNDEVIAYVVDSASIEGGKAPVPVDLIDQSCVGVGISPGRVESRMVENDASGLNLVGTRPCEER